MACVASVQQLLLAHTGGGTREGRGAPLVDVDGVGRQGWVL